MSRRVYTLKRATPRMKYRHMVDVMEFKRGLRTPSDTDTLLLAIRDILTKRHGGVTEQFHRWFDRIYDAYRFHNPAKYKQLIRGKYYYERRMLSKSEGEQ